MQLTKLILKSDPRKISEVEYFVKRFARDLNIAEDIFPNILISVTEAVNNAIIHGNQQNSSKDVKIELSTNREILTIKVSDQGAGFNPNSVPDPTLAENLDKLGGRGVFLIQQLSDKVLFKNNGRTVEMKFNI